MCRNDKKNKSNIESKLIEFNILGTLYTGNKEVSIDELSDRFIDFVESNGWQFCGITKPLEDEK